MKIIFGANSTLFPLPRICCQKFSWTILSVMCTAGARQRDAIMCAAFCSFL
jgi:hypothetical protein